MERELAAGPHAPRQRHGGRKPPRAAWPSGPISDCRCSGRKYSQCHSGGSGVPSAGRSGAASSVADSAATGCRRDDVVDRFAAADPLAQRGFVEGVGGVAALIVTRCLPYSLATGQRLRRARPSNAGGWPAQVPRGGRAVAQAEHALDLRALRLAARPTGRMRCPPRSGDSARARGRRVVAPALPGVRQRELDVLPFRVAPCSSSSGNSAERPRERASGPRWASCCSRT